MERRRLLARLARERLRAAGLPCKLRFLDYEALTAALFVAVSLRPFTAPELALQLAFVSLLVVITFIDIDYLIIPDAISIPSILVAPGLAFVVGHITIVESLVGIVAGGGILWAFAAAYEKLRGQEGMGFGDVKLLAMIGGVQGWQAVPFSLFVGATVGALAGTALLALGRGRLDSAIPFGPFLALGALLYVVGGPELTAWYFSWTGPFG